MRLPEQIPHYDPYDEDPAGDGSGWGTRAACALIAGTAVLGLTVMLAGAGAPSGPPQPGAVQRSAQLATGSLANPLGAAVPTWISVPAIDVQAPLMNVGLDAEGWLEAPPQQIDNLAGWLETAPAPGARGTAVIVGHVDNASGPAVFYGLGTLRPGDAVEVIREDGMTVWFTVYDIAVYDKDEVPQDVYQDRGGAELRIITCGGSFSADSGYSDNVVVFARMAGAA